MKVTSVQNTTVADKYKNIEVQKFSGVKTTAADSFTHSSPSFRGATAAQSLVDVWAAIARGGFAASFILNDVGGTGVPRAITSLHRGKEITGQNNVPAAIGTLKRELISGPSMFVVPLLVLAGSCSLSGSANKVPISVIDDLSAVTKGSIENFNEIIKPIIGDLTFSDLKKPENSQILEKAALKLKETIYKDTFSTVLKNGQDKEVAQKLGSGFMDTFREGVIGVKNIDDVALEYASKMIDSQAAPKRNIFQMMLNKNVKKYGCCDTKAKDQIINELKDLFMVDKKLNNKDIEQCLSAEFLQQNGKKHKYEIGKLIDNMENYANDFVKQYIKAQAGSEGKQKIKIPAGEFVERFNNLRKGSRYITNIAMVIATALFMWVVPKLYMEGDVNPETAAYQKAEKGGNQ